MDIQIVKHNRNKDKTLKSMMLTIQTQEVRVGVEIEREQLRSLLLTASKAWEAFCFDGIKCKVCMDEGVVYCDGDDGEGHTEYGVDERPCECTIKNEEEN